MKHISFFAQHYLSVDILGSTAFAPVRIDIQGNIKVSAFCCKIVLIGISTFSSFFPFELYFLDLMELYLQ